MAQAKAGRQICWEGMVRPKNGEALKIDGHFIAIKYLPFPRKFPRLQRER